MKTSEFVTINNDILYKSGKEIQFRGVNLGNWMQLEHFMMGMPTVDYFIRRRTKEVLGEKKYEAFMGTYMEEYYTEEDFRFLSDLGVNFVRLPFGFRMFEDPRKPGIYKDDACKYINKVIEFCRKYDMHVLLDLHSVQGAQASDWNADSLHGEANLWEYRDHMTRTADLWRWLADKYKDEDRVMGFEIMNEPVAEDYEQLQEFNRMMVAAIRKSDKDHIIVINYNRHSTVPESVAKDLFNDEKVMTTSHHYHQYNFPFRDIPKFPGEYEGKIYGDAELIETLGSKCDTSLYGRPVLMGEFGVKYNMEYTNTQIDMIDSFLGHYNETGTHWSIWCYKDLQEMGFVNPKADSAWKKFIFREDVRKPLNEFMKELPVFARKLEPSFPASEGEYWFGGTHWFQREITRKFQHYYLEHMLKKLSEHTEEELREMARSWNFSNCKVNERMEKVLKKRLS